MLDAERAALIKTSLRGGPTEDEDGLHPLTGLTQEELRSLRVQINDRLPKDKIDALNLEEELVSQYRVTKSLMHQITTDIECPVNQKAQVANSVVSCLSSLVKLQEDMRREETLKIMETCLIEVVKTLPEAQRDEFYAEYEILAKKEGLL